MKWLKVTSQRLKIVEDQGGYILGLVMVFFIVFSIIGLSFIKMGSHERIHALNNYHKDKAYYNAYSGIQRGVWLAAKVSAAAATFSDGTVSVVYDSVNLIMTATGTAGNAQDSIRAVLTRSGGSSSGGTDLLFVVKNALNLTTDETTMKALMESWGYTVVAISENATQADFDAAVDTSDVAYVGDKVTPGAVDTKLKNIAIGVVNTDERLHDEFGFSSQNTGYNSTTIDITDDSHYITATFGTGFLTILTSSETLFYTAGTVAPGLQVLAEQPSGTDGTVVVIDVGGPFWDTGTAAGRRVQLPWGRNTFDFDSLNDDGNTLVKRSIQWAAGAYIDDVIFKIATWEEL